MMQAVEERLAYIELAYCIVMSKETEMRERNFTKIKSERNSLRE